MDLVNGSIGSVGEYHLEFSAGKLLISAKATEGPVSESASISVSSRAVLEAVAKKIGGGPLVQQALELLAVELDKV